MLDGLGAQARQAPGAERPAPRLDDDTSILTTGRAASTPPTGRALRRHPRRRHPAAARRGRAPRRHDRPPAEPGRSSTRRPAGSPQGYGVLQPRITLDAARRSTRRRSSSGSSPARPASIRTPPPSPTSTRTCSARAASPARGSTTSTRSSAAMADRVPENALLSHDLFEGVFARAGLVTDVELFDEFPSNYLVAAARQHRWARGDWQLLPWILGPGTRRDGQRRGPALPAHRPLEDARQPAPDAVGARSPLATLVAAWTLPARRRRGRGPRSSWRPDRAPRPCPSLAGVLPAPAGHLQAQPPPGASARTSPSRSPRSASASRSSPTRRGSWSTRSCARWRASSSPAGTCSNGRPRPRRRRSTTSTSAGFYRQMAGGVALAGRRGRRSSSAAKPAAGLDRGAVRRRSGCCRRSSPAGSACRRAESAAEQLSAGGRGGAPPDRPPDVALLRDLRRARGPRPAARQLPGRPASRSSPIARRRRTSGCTCSRP